MPPTIDITRGRDHLAGELGDRVQLVAVVEDPDRADDQAAATSTAGRPRCRRRRCGAGSAAHAPPAIATAKPASNATPPSRGVSTACTSRSRGLATAPHRVANCPGQRRAQERDPARRSGRPTRIRRMGARRIALRLSGLRVCRMGGDQRADLGADLGVRRRRRRWSPRGRSSCAISVICGSVMPWVVTAGVPTRTPEATEGGPGRWGWRSCSGRCRRRRSGLGVRAR